VLIQSASFYGNNPSVPGSITRPSLSEHNASLVLAFF
jgi:hypothetical protein